MAKNKGGRASTTEAAPAAPVATPQKADPARVSPGVAAETGATVSSTGATAAASDTAAAKALAQKQAAAREQKLGDYGGALLHG